MAQGGKVLDWTLMRRRGRDLGLAWSGLRWKEVEILDWTQERGSRDLGLDLVEKERSWPGLDLGEKKSGSWTALRREEEEILDWTQMERS